MGKRKKKEEIQVPSIALLEAELVRVKAKEKFRKTLLSVAGVLTVAAAVTALILTRIFVLIQISGSSMSPTLTEGEIVVLHEAGDIEQGDLIGFYYGGNILLKRVIGRGGDVIEIDRKGNVYVNDEQLEEPYLKEHALGECELKFPYEVPDGMFFVLGDNREVSLDSRIKTIGCVKSEQIVGEVVFRMWPLEQIGNVH